MQWKAVLLYFVRGWAIGDIAAHFGVASHRISQSVNEWAMRALALGYIQVIDPERFTAWSGTEALHDASPVWAFELRTPPAAVSRVSLANEAAVGRGSNRGRPSRSPQAANTGLAAALDVAIARCEERPGEFWSQAATQLRDLRSAIEAASWTSDGDNLGPAPHALAEELLYAFES